MSKDESKTRIADSHSPLGLSSFLVTMFFGICTCCALVANLQATLSSNLVTPSRQDKAATSDAELFFFISLFGLGIGSAMAILALRQKNRRKTLPTLAIGLCLLICLLVVGPAVFKVVS